MTLENEAERAASRERLANDLRSAIVERDRATQELAKSVQRRNNLDDQIEHLIKALT